MGVWDAIKTGVGEAWETVVPIAAEMGMQWLGRQFAPEPVYGGGGGGPPGGGYVQPSLPISVGTSPYVSPGGIPMTTMPVSMPTMPIVDVPSEIPWGRDPAGIMAGGLFKPAKTTVVPTRFITAKNPVTGSIVFWEHAGRPVLFSRDLRVVKRVSKIAARAARGTRRRRTCRKR